MALDAVREILVGENRERASTGLAASWQIECCGEPFAVDQVVRWQLLFTEVGRWRGEPPEHEVTLAGQAEPFVWEEGERDRTYVQLRVGSAVLYWSASEIVAGAVTVTGSVHEDHHGGAHRGLARFWRVGACRPSASYRDVGTSPTWFDDAAGDTARRRAETGVLVDLEVDDPPPSRCNSRTAGNIAGSCGLPGSGVEPASARRAPANSPSKASPASSRWPSTRRRSCWPSVALAQGDRDPRRRTGSKGPPWTSHGRSMC